MYHLNFCTRKREVVGNFGILPDFLACNCFCVVINYIFVFSDCPQLESLPSLPSQTSCVISASCSGVKCCTDIALLKTSIQTGVSVDKCRGKVFIQLEKLDIVLMLKDFNYSSWQTYTIQNVFRLE
jgi:hypothetical protein